MIYPLNTST